MGRPGLTLRHAYPLINTTDRPVGIVRAINLKSCCGDIDLEPVILQPGDRATLDVAVRVGETIGPISHVAVVETDHPDAEALEFWTTAHGYPRVRIEDVGQGVTSLLPGQEARREFVAVTHGDRDAPPLALDGAAIESALDVEWVGPAEDRELGDGLIERSRGFSALMTDDGRIGPKVEEVALKDGEAIALRHLVRWEVVPRITASPAMAVFTPSRRGCDILLRSRDETPFRVTRITLDAPGVRGEARESSITPGQRIVVVAGETPAAAGGRVTMTIETDHPAQAVVEVPVVFLDGPRDDREAKP